MQDHRTQLATLIASRICHDLISPVGAISNGLELVALGGSLSNGPELSLINESCASASARIRFFRVAFGAARGQDMGAAEISSILQDKTALGRLSIDWQYTENVARSDARLLFLLILCLETAMPFEGHITVSRSPRRWRLEGKTKRMNAVPEMWEILSNPAMPPNLSPGEVHFALVGPALAAANRRLSVELGETSIRISA